MHVKFHHIKTNCLGCIELQARNSVLLLYTVALVYSVQETIAVVELWTYIPILYDARSNCMNESAVI